MAEWNRQYRAGEKPTALKGEQFPWVYESPRDANARPFANLGKAFARFFNKEARRPRFKKKGKCRESFYVANDKFHVDGNTITLPRIGKVRMREALRFKGKVTGATVSRTADRWFVAISVEVEMPLVPCENQARTVGVDLGVRRLATISDGTFMEGPKPLRSTLKRLARLNRRLHRKVAGSSNRVKAAMGVARCHGRVVRMRGERAAQADDGSGAYLWACCHRRFERQGHGTQLPTGPRGQRHGLRGVSAPDFLQGGAVVHETGGG